MERPTGISNNTPQNSQLNSQVLRGSKEILQATQTCDNSTTTTIKNLEFKPNFCSSRGTEYFPDI